MKKLNRKKKKLEFIRFKNNLRTGKFICSDYIKISIDIIDSTLLDLLKKERHLFLEKKYKLKLKYSHYTIGCDGLDFVRNMCTMLLTATNRESFKDKKDEIISSYLTNLK